MLETKILAFPVPFPLSYLRMEGKVIAEMQDLWLVDTARLGHLSSLCELQGKKKLNLQKFAFLAACKILWLDEKKLFRKALWSNCSWLTHFFLSAVFLQSLKTFFLRKIKIQDGVKKNKTTPKTPLCSELECNSRNGNTVAFE